MSLTDISYLKIFDRNVDFEVFWRTNLFKGGPPTVATSKLAACRTDHIWGLPNFPEFQNYIVLKKPFITPWDSVLTHIHTECTDNGSHFILIMVRPALDQPWQGSGARVMCSALHAGGSSLLFCPCHLRADFSAGVGDHPPRSDCKMLSYAKKAGLNLKIGLGPKRMHHCLFLQCRHLWTGRSFR